MKKLLGVVRSVNHKALPSLNEGNFPAMFLLYNCIKSKSDQDQILQEEFNFKKISRNQLPPEFCAITPGAATSPKHKHLSE